MRAKSKPGLQLALFVPEVEGTRDSSPPSSCNVCLPLPGRGVLPPWIDNQELGSMTEQKRWLWQESERGDDKQPRREDAYQKHTGTLARQAGVCLWEQVRIVWVECRYFACFTVKAVCRIAALWWWWRLAVSVKLCKDGYLDMPGRLCTWDMYGVMRT